LELDVQEMVMKHIHLNVLLTAPINVHWVLLMLNATMVTQEVIFLKEKSGLTEEELCLSGS
jgi:hypothetical protein